MNTNDFPRNPIEKANYRLDFHDEFDSTDLNTEKWIPFYLPQWSSRKQSKPSYTLQDNSLILQIDADQEPWCPEFDGDVKCSSLQTGCFAGNIGSPVGQHRFNDACVVREAQTTQRTYTPQYGYFEARVKADSSPHGLVALWMIGFEEVPQESGEIAIFEIFGDYLMPNGSEVRYGVHPWQDKTLSDEFYRDMLPIDATQFHIYAVEWKPTEIDFYVDNVKRRTIYQSPAYPMQFMMGIYDLPNHNSHDVTYPRQFTIDYFRAYQPVDGYDKPYQNNDN